MCQILSLVTNEAQASHRGCNFSFNDVHTNDYLRDKMTFACKFVQPGVSH